MRRTAAAFVALLAWGSAARAELEFDFALDRLIIGQRVLLLDDGFDDDELGPVYIPTAGTGLTESGGFLLLTHADGAQVFDPNSIADIVHVDPVPAGWFDGQGDGSAGAVFRPDIPEPGRSYFLFAVDENSFGGIVAFEHALELEPEVDPAGCLGDEPNVIVLIDLRKGVTGCARVEPASVTGSVLLGFDFNDLANTVSPWYSLDGGATIVTAPSWDVPPSPVRLPLTALDPAVAIGFGAEALRLDMDDDGVFNREDNCPHAPNPDQTDADGNDIGDACQCGDVNGDGLTNVTDALEIARGEVLSGDPHFGKCDVNGDDVCNVTDALEIARGEVGSLPGEQLCPTYLGVSP